MILRITFEELELFRQFPLPWWNSEARWSLNKVAPGQPAIEVDENDNPTGYVLMSDPGIDVWDLYLLDVMRAGWAYANSIPDGDLLVEFQRSNDWTAWESLKSRLNSGQVTIDQAIALARQYILGLGQSLGVPDPILDEVI